MDNWRTLSLRDAGVVLIDCVHKTPPAVETGYPYIAIPQMKNGRVDFSDARRISRDDFIEWTRKAQPQVHDVVLSRRTNPGVTATFGEACEFALGQNLVLLRADGRFVRPEFLRWLTVSPAWWSQIEKYNNVGAVFDSLRCADVPRFELPIPPLREQDTIASILRALDDKIDLNRRMNATLEAMARAIFKDWFVDFGPTRAKIEGRSPYLAAETWALFPNRLANEGKPEGWETRSLLDLCELKRGYDLPSQDRVTGEIPIMSSSGPTGWHNVAMAQTPGIVTGRYGTIGQVFACHVDFWPLNTTLYVRDFKGHPFWFVYHVLSGLAFSKFTDKAAVPGINRNDLHREPVTFPTAELIAAFNAIASPLMTKVRSNDAESQFLVSLRDLLIPKLMSGEIRLHDAEKMVEAAA